MKKFDREQLVFIIEIVFSGVKEQVESALPPAITLNDFNSREKRVREYIQGAVNVVSMSLPVLCAELTGEGIGRADFAQFREFDRMVDTYIDLHTMPSMKKTGIFPDTKHLAESFVDTYFAKYLEVQ